MPSILYRYETLQGIQLNIPGLTTLCEQDLEIALRNTDGPINLNWPEIENAALVTAALIGPTPQLNRYEIQWRIAGVRTACWGGVNGPLQATLSYLDNQLDPSETRTLSYHMGSTLCCCIAELSAVALGQPLNMMHCSRFINQHGVNSIRFQDGMRPDYISQFGGGGNAFQIWEAKCRRSVTLAGMRAALTAALNQARSVETILGQPPSSSVAVLATLDQNDTWGVVIADPSLSSEGQISGAEQDLFYYAYYHPWVDLIDNIGKAVDKRPFVTAELIPGETYAGLDKDIYDIIKKWKFETTNPGDLTNQIELILRQGYQLRNETEYVNTNGIYCSLTDQALKAARND